MTEMIIFIAIAFLLMGFMFGFTVGNMVTIETIEQKIKRDKE